MRCTPTAEFTDSCTLDKAWTFDSVAGSLKSHPRTVTVELPQSATKLKWSLITRSRLADAATSVALLAQPGSSAPATQPGFYRGTAKVGTGVDAMVVPVDLYVTTNDVAVYEPTRFLFPEGSMVYRLGSSDTYFPWFAADVANGTDFKVRLRPTSSQFTAASKRFVSTFTLGLLNGDIAVEIDAVQQGALPAACGAACAAGSYCQTDMNVCLPDAAPVRTVAAQSPTVPGVIDSTRLTAWEQVLTPSIVNNVRLSGRDVASVERAMCYRSEAQQGPGRFGDTTTAPSRELTCSDGLPPAAFELLNQTKSLTVQQNVETFNLLDRCLEDLAAPPSAALATPKVCASLPRFFAAIRPGATMTARPVVASMQARCANGSRLTHSPLAPVHRSVSTTTWSTAAVQRCSRLDELLTLVENGWRVALDRRVQSKLTKYWEAARSDYRDVARPIHRWSFTGMHSGNFVVPDREGTNGLRITNYDTNTESRLSIANTMNATCETEQAVDVGRGGFSIGAFIGSAWTGMRVLVSKDGPTPFIITMTHDTNSSPWVTVNIGNIAYGLKFVVPYEPGYYVLTASGDYGAWKLYHLNSQLKVYTPQPPSSPWSNAWWGQPGKIQILCQSTNSDTILLMDELAIWDHELPRETIEALARRTCPCPLRCPMPTLRS